MKKNWLVVVFCLTFIVAWQVFVANPYLRQHSPAASLNGTKDATNDTKVEAVANSANVSIDSKLTVPVELKVNDEKEELLRLNLDPYSALALTAGELNEAQRVEQSEMLNFRVTKNATIGRAEFEKFLVRGSKEKKSVKILEDGLRWVSTDPQIALCLAKMQTAPESSREKLVFRSQTSAGSCEIEYGFMGEHGKVSNSLTLTGFKQSTGFVEFRGRDGLGLGEVLDHNTLIAQIDGSQKKVKEKDLFLRGLYTGKVDWIVWGDKYFVTVLLPRGNFNPNVVYGGTTGNESLKDEDKRISFGAQYPIINASNNVTKYEMDMTFSIRDPELLSEIHPTLHKAVDLGWFGSVGRLMLWALKKINSFVHNFGVAIIVLTLVVRMIFWPLNKRVFLSGIKMKGLSPEIEKLKKKYGNDKSRAAEMNQEMMGLYKKHNVNPLGSCLPLLLQMPIFIGLYQALSHSIDLYQAPFFGWITDLSSKDHFYVFPVLWTVTLIAYVFVNPQQNVQQQGMPDMKWIMVVMNVFFGFLSMSWPSGLTLYLFVSNLVGISQQLFFQRAYKLQPIQEGA